MKTYPIRDRNGRTVRVTIPGDDVEYVAAIMITDDAIQGMVEIVREVAKGICHPGKGGAENCEHCLSCRARALLSYTELTYKSAKARGMNGLAKGMEGCWLCL